MTLVAATTDQDSDDCHRVKGPEIPASFRAWRSGVVKAGQLPIIGVAGLRGKTTIIHMLDHILRTSGHRTALWTSNGVEINGRSQPGELGAWKDALRRVIDGDVSVVFQELDWATVLAAGLPLHFYPVLAVTNICGNDEVCQIHREARLAMKAIPRVLQAVSPNGALVLNGEDYTLADALQDGREQPAVLYALSRHAPLLRRHLALGGLGSWRDGDAARFGSEREAPVAAQLPGLAYTLAGDAPFQVTNVLASLTIARLLGLTPTEIEIALQSYEPNPRKMPGTFTIVQHHEARIILDRPDPSWFLRPVLRSIRTHSRGRLIVVAGRMEAVPLDDIEEVGRMLGRDAEALVLHDHLQNPERTDMLLKGVARAFNPPLVVRVASEGRAISAALRRLRAHDTALILADDSPKALAAVQRTSRHQTAQPDDAFAASVELD